ncbi:30S ribosomal protein S21 [archaeon]|nr:MAG: 30S ribosomal protein S21 [archaeon]
MHTIIGEDETLDSAVKRFRRQVRNSGHLMDMRYKEHWETAQAKRKRKAENARRQNKYERMNDRFERKRLGLGDYM